MNVTKVESNKDKKTFIEVPLKIYKNDKNWIRPLDKDINSVFSKDKNKTYRNGEAIRWLLKDNGEVIGRIAAFYSSKNTEDKGLKVGGCGFLNVLIIKKLPIYYLILPKIGLKIKDITLWTGQ